MAATVKIAGAVIAAGSVVVNSEVKKVQHPDGGTVAEILVSNGQEVEAGELLARLDTTLARANLAIISAALDEILAKRARLLAERDGLANIVFDPELLRRRGEESLDSVLVNELRCL